MKKISFKIPTMQSSHCQQRVATALSELNALELLSLEAGNLTAGLSDQIPVKEVVSLIEGLGYRVDKVQPLADSEEQEDILLFKTDIKCSGCTSKIAPYLDSESAITHWQVDLQDPDKVLSVRSNGMTAGHLMQTVRNAGFNIEPIKKET